MYKVNLLLADAAQVADGKLYVLGGGWDTIVPGAPILAAVSFARTPLTEMIERHYRALLDGAHAGIAGRLDALGTELEDAARAASDRSPGPVCNALEP